MNQIECQKSVLHSEYGVPDTLRYGLYSAANNAIESMPLEKRIAQWDNLAFENKLKLSRDLYGLHAPLRKLMDKQSFSSLKRLPFYPGSNLGMEVLDGKDETLDFEDFLNDPCSSTQLPDVHVAMEHRMNWKF